MVRGRCRSAVAVGLASLLAACARGAPIHAPTVVFVDAVAGETAPASSGDSTESAGSWKARDEVVGPDRIRERRAELQLEEGEEPEDEPDPP